MIRVDKATHKRGNNMLKHLSLTILLAAAVLFARASWATETENLGIRILPTPGKVTVDGNTDDWDLTAGVFVCSDVERLKDQYSVWYHMMWDEDNIYLLARWSDPTPLNHPGSLNGSFGFHGDCLQARFIADEGTEDERVSHWTCWMDKHGKDILQGVYGRKFKSGEVEDAQKEGGAQAFRKGEDGETYVQEIAIPWTLLTTSGKAPAVGKALWTTVEPNFTAGAAGRITIKGIFRPGVPPDRIFAFRAYKQWGDATIEKSGAVTPKPVRLADAREFPVTMQDGKPVVDWDGLIVSKLWPGFEKLAFNMPFDGTVSLNLHDDKGRVVRQLLTGQFFAKGARTVEWDGLTTPYVDDPGGPVPPGKYTWSGIANPGISMRLRGWAYNGGSHPWADGPGTGWGGNHGVPWAVAADGDKVYLGWEYSEGPAPLVAVNLDGKVQWRLGMGGKNAATALAVDAGTVYAGFDFNQAIYRVDAKTGEFTSWEGTDSTELHIEALWDKPEGMPNTFHGMDAAGGKVYLAFGSPSRFSAGQVIDWKKLLTKLVNDPGPLAVITDSLRKPRDRKAIEQFLHGEKELVGVPTHKVIRSMNHKLNDPALGEDGVTPLARRQAAHTAVMKAYAGLLHQAKGDFVAVLDGATGKLQKTLPLHNPSALVAIATDRILCVANGTDVLALNPETGKSEPFIKDVGNVTDLAVDGEGRVCVLLRDPDNQLKVFDKTGKLVETLGTKGGRAPLGPWDAEGMREPSALVVDAKGRAWVAESLKTPKRFVVWDLKDKSVWKEFFGPAQYGAGGGAINPRDPNLMVGQACEWRLDPKTGRATCLGVIEQNINPGCAMFREGANGKLYLFLEYTNRSSDKYGVYLFLREGDGQYTLVADFRDIGSPKKTASIWIDRNSDGQEQPEEVKALDKMATFKGELRRSLNVGPDMELIVLLTTPVEGRKRGPSEWVRVPVTGFTDKGVPLYGWDKLEVLKGIDARLVHDRAPNAFPSWDGKTLLVHERVPELGLVWACYTADGTRRLWDYPNTFHGVHGSHKAPPPTPGLIRGAFGIVGAATLPEPVGNVWVINSNVGEWHVLNEDGFYVTRLFEGDPFKRRWPKQAVPGAIMDTVPCGGGAEDFGGSVIQGKDGVLYIQSGQQAYWNLKTMGWDKIVALPGGTVEIAAEEVELAKKFRAEALQKARGKPILVAKRLTPTFTGDLSKDFADCQIAEYQKQAGAEVKTAVAWDAKNLYVGWEVRDGTPWINKAGEAPMMYAGGDSVDLQFGTNPDADPERTKEEKGDIRINIGPFKDEATAVIYRRVSDTKKPRVFSSGVVAAYPVDYVAVLGSAKIHVDADAKRKRYVVEVALPLADLGLKPEAGLKIRGDFGAMHSDATGQNAVLRTYWSRQDTGLVDDVVFELQATPKNWGEILFRE